MSAHYSLSLSLSHSLTHTHMKPPSTLSVPAHLAHTRTCSGTMRNPRQQPTDLKMGHLGTAT